jgi:short subunit dehydrogenase-like uncharacterized protein
MPAGMPSTISGTTRAPRRRTSTSRRWRHVIHADSRKFTGTNAVRMTSIGIRNDARAIVRIVAPKPSVASTANARKTIAEKAAIITGETSGARALSRSRGAVRTTTTLSPPPASLRPNA